MWTNEEPMNINDMQLLNMVCAKGLRPADNPPDQALLVHAIRMFETHGRNYPWKELTRKKKQFWVHSYQRELKRSWGPFEILP